jgi:hypothetical protein
MGLDLQFLAISMLAILVSSLLFKHLRNFFNLPWTFVAFIMNYFFIYM